MTVLIRCSGVWKKYRRAACGIKELIVAPRRRSDSRYSREWALRDVSLAISRGSAFGVVGHNGTGKSTLLSLLLGTLRPDLGEIAVSGRVASLLELGAGFHPELSGRENVFLYGAILGMRMAETREKLSSILAFSELGNAIDDPIRTYSSGMVARLGFSTIIHTQADILLIDEALAVGDLAFQEKCRSFLKEFRARNGTLVIASHDMGVVEATCDEGVCLTMGAVVERGPIAKVVAHYNRSQGRCPIECGMAAEA